MKTVTVDEIIEELEERQELYLEDAKEARKLARNSYGHGDAEGRYDLTVELLAFIRGEG